MSQASSYKSIEKVLKFNIKTNVTAQNTDFASPFHHQYNAQNTYCSLRYQFSCQVMNPKRGCKNSFCKAFILHRKNGYLLQPTTTIYTYFTNEIIPNHQIWPLDYRRINEKYPTAFLRKNSMFPQHINKNTDQLPLRSLIVGFPAKCEGAEERIQKSLYLGDSGGQ